MNRRCFAAVSIVALLLPLACMGSAEIGGYANLVRRVAPSVVTVVVEEKQISAGQRAAEHASAESTNDIGALIRRLLTGGIGGPEDQRPTGALGSGFVIRADGLIVTNRHVVNGAFRIRVRLPDGRDVPAKLLGADAVTDIALLKVSVGNLPALRLGTSQSVSVGDPVIAIGNPFGLGQSVSAGIISARGRTLEDDPYIDFLQTDAAINHGNSGGPLMSPEGTVVGITSAIFSPSGGSVRIGFCHSCGNGLLRDRSTGVQGPRGAGLSWHIGAGADADTGQGAGHESTDGCVDNLSGSGRTGIGRFHSRRCAARHRFDQSVFQNLGQADGAPAARRARHHDPAASGQVRIYCVESGASAGSSFGPGAQRRSGHVGAWAQFGRGQHD